MGLAVTVQRGHNFSTGEINRAALNNGATPTISITGSVGISELGQNSVNDSKIASGANINVNKLSVPTGNVIVGASGVDQVRRPAPRALMGKRVESSCWSIPEQQTVLRQYQQTYRQRQAM